MKVSVIWLKSPRHKYGIYKQPGLGSLLDVEVAKKIRKESPGMFESPELDELLKEKPVKVKDTMAKKPMTRPVTREKKS